MNAKKTYAYVKTYVQSIHIHFDEHNGRELTSQLLENGLDTLARSAPGGREVDDKGLALGEEEEEKQRYECRNSDKGVGFFFHIFLILFRVGG